MLAQPVQTSKTTFYLLYHRCKQKKLLLDRCTVGSSISKNVLAVVWTPTEILCWRYSYVELMWELILSRNAKMKRETEISDFAKRLPAARNRSKFSGNAKMRRETDQNLRKVTFCDGKYGSREQGKARKSERADG